MLLGLQVLALSALVAQFPVLATACSDVPVSGAGRARAVPELGLSFIICEYPRTGRFASEASLLTFPTFAALVLIALSTLLLAAALLWRRVRAPGPAAINARPRRVAPLSITVLAAQALALPMVAMQWPVLMMECTDSIFRFVNTGVGRDDGPLRVSCHHVTDGESGVVHLWTFPALAAAVLMVVSMVVAMSLLLRRERRS